MFPENPKPCTDQTNHPGPGYATNTWIVNFSTQEYHLLINVVAGIGRKTDIVRATFVASADMLLVFLFIGRNHIYEDGSGTFERDTVSVCADADEK